MRHHTAGVQAAEGQNGAHRGWSNPELHTASFSWYSVLGWLLFLTLLLVWEFQRPKGIRCKFLWALCNSLSQRKGGEGGWDFQTVQQGRCEDILLHGGFTTGTQPALKAGTAYFIDPWQIIVSASVFLVTQTHRAVNQYRPSRMTRLEGPELGFPIWWLCFRNEE